MNTTRNARSIAVAATLTTTFATGLLAQGSWDQPMVTGQAPLRAGHAAVYDLARERVVMFGGFDPSYTPQGSTHEFVDLGWSDVTTAGAPSPRAGHAMAYDMTRGRVVLFGGTAGLMAAPLDDTWEFDGTTWTQRFPSQMPSARLDHAMAYDVVNQSSLLFGGRSANHAELGDTWRWDGNEWVQVATTTGPAPRRGHALSCDFSRACVVMFGGFAGTSFGDTWEWNGSAWLERTVATAPSARSNHGIAFDFVRGVTILHGGTDGGDETWEWDGGNWAQHGSTSLAKTDHVLVYDARLRRTTLCSGTSIGPAVFHAEVETYGHEVPGSFELRGTSCPGSTATPQLYAPTSLASGPMIGHSPDVQIHNSWFHSLFLFGWSDTLDGATPLPFDLSTYGMPGCSLQISLDGAVSVMPQNGVATLTMPIPNDPFLVGLSYFIQGMALDPAANAAGYTTTNRIMATIGRY